MNGAADRRVGLAERYAAHPVSWIYGWEALLDADADVFEAYLDLADSTAGGLDERARQLILIAINAAPTHLAADAVRLHTGAALDAGVAPGEIVEVLGLVAILGMHSCTVGVPIIVEALAADGHDVVAEPLDERAARVERDYALTGAYWQQFEKDIPIFLEATLRLDPEWLAAFLEVSGLSWRAGTLSPKFKELVYFAIDASTTHLHVPGMRLHARNALAFGATVRELVEVAQLAATIGGQSFALGLPILSDALRAREASA